jgi:hypothetical protein
LANWGKEKRHAFKPAVPGLQSLAQGGPIMTG